MRRGCVIGAEYGFKGSHAQRRCIVGKAVVNLLGFTPGFHKIGPPQFGKLLAKGRLGHARGGLDVRHLPLTTQQTGQDHEALGLSEDTQLFDRDIG